jgi:hypothetical protein
MAMGRVAIVIAFVAFVVLVGACRHAGWRAAPGLGVEIDAPSGARVEETPGHAFVSDDNFALNLFAVDALSAVSADAQLAQLEQMEGFVRVTHQERAGSTWRFDYELDGGTKGTIARIRVGVRELDCSVHDVASDVAAAVGRACSRVRLAR